MKWKVSKLAFLPVLLCALSTVLLLPFPLTAYQRELITGPDKWIHAVAFALLTACAAWALAGCLKGRIRVLILTAVLAMIFAALDELAQLYVPSRTVDIWDWVANCLGITIGLIVYSLIALLVSAMYAKTGNELERSLEE